MLITILQLVGGGLFLWLAGEAVVRGAASLALRRGVSHLVIGLTIVAFGTSAPELFVSMIAAWQGNPDIALGNVIGSNIANLGLVLGLTALLKPIIIHQSLLKKEIPFLIIVSIAVILLSANQLLERWNGLILLSGLIVFIYYCLKTSNPTDEGQLSSETPALLKSNWQEWLLLLLGFIGLIIGSKLFIDGAVKTARYFGLSEFFIGLSIVALGTSLPELAASLIAVIRKQTDLAVGNLIGSNIFNILLILGTVTTIKPIQVLASALRFDFWIMLILTLLLFPISRTQKKINRLEGTLLLSIYVFYIVKVAWRG